VQVDPINPTWKAPGTKRLKQTYDERLSSFAFKFNLRRYSLVIRLNDAPTVGFEEFVGSKTTFRYGDHRLTGQSYRGHYMAGQSLQGIS
jgi:hypothetical protein